MERFWIKCGFRVLNLLCDVTRNSKWAIRLWNRYWSWVEQNHPLYWGGWTEEFYDDAF